MLSERVLLEPNDLPFVKRKTKSPDLPGTRKIRGHVRF